MWHREVSNLELLIPKLYFEGKTPVFTAFLYRSTDQPTFCERSDYALLRLEHVAIWHREVSNLELLIPKLYFEAKTPVFTAFLYRSTDQPTFCERSELLIRQVYQFELGCIKKIAH